MPRKNWIESLNIKVCERTRYKNKNSMGESTFDANENLVVKKLYRDLRKNWWKGWEQERIDLENKPFKTLFKFFFSIRI